MITWASFLVGREEVEISWGLKWGHLTFVLLSFPRALSSVGPRQELMYPLFPVHDRSTEAHMFVWFEMTGNIAKVQERDPRLISGLVSQPRRTVLL